MATNQYALEVGAPKRLTLRTPLMKGIQVEFDGQLVDSFASSGASRPRDVELPDGSVITLRRTAALYGPAAFEITRNGRHLPGSAGDPTLSVRDAASSFYVVATINVAVAAFFGVARLRDGTGLPPEFLLTLFASALIFAVCGLGASRGSLTAIGAGTLLHGYLTVEATSATIQSDGATGNVVLRWIFLVVFLRGLHGAWTLRKRRSDAAEATAADLPPAA